MRIRLTAPWMVLAAALLSAGPGAAQDTAADRPPGATEPVFAAAPPELLAQCDTGLDGKGAAMTPWNHSYVCAIAGDVAIGRHDGQAAVDLYRHACEIDPRRCTWMRMRLGKIARKHLLSDEQVAAERAWAVAHGVGGNWGADSTVAVAATAPAEGAAPPPVAAPPPGAPPPATASPTAPPTIAELASLNEIPCKLGDLEACLSLADAWEEHAQSLHPVGRFDEEEQAYQAAIHYYATACGHGVGGLPPDQAAARVDAAERAYEARHAQCLEWVFGGPEVFAAHEADVQARCYAEQDALYEETRTLSRSRDACSYVGAMHLDRQWSFEGQATLVRPRSAAAALNQRGAAAREEARAVFGALCAVEQAITVPTRHDGCESLQRMATEDAENAAYAAQQAAQDAAFRRQMAGILVAGAGQIVSAVATGQQQLDYARQGLIYDPNTGQARAPGGPITSVVEAAPDAASCSASCKAQCAPYRKECEAGQNQAPCYQAQVCLCRCARAAGGCSLTNEEIDSCITQGEARLRELGSSAPVVTGAPGPAPAPAPASSPGTCPPGQGLCTHADGSYGCGTLPRGTPSASDTVYCAGG